MPLVFKFIRKVSKRTPSLDPWEITVILVVLVSFFGAKKLPDAARSLGHSMRVFKSEVEEMRNDDEQQEQVAIQQAPQARPQQPYQPQQQYQQPAPQAQPQQQYQQPYQPQPGQGNPGQPQQ